MWYNKIKRGGLIEMTKLEKLSPEELKSKLQELKDKDFALKMIDTWTSEDYRYSDELHQQIMAVEKEIEKRS